MTIQYVGGINIYNSSTIIATPRKLYNYEIVRPAEATTYQAKIGLMYASDYSYATSPENWNTFLHYNNDTAINNNWMFTGLSEWTISHYAGDSYTVDPYRISR